MWQYDARAGIIARSYALARSSELPHFDKNAQFLEKWFSQMLEDGLLCHTEICSPQLHTFCEQFASLAYETDPLRTPRIEDDVFNKMCYIFVLYATYATGLLVDKSLTAMIEKYSVVLSISEQDTLWFFKKVLDDVWMIASAEARFKHTFFEAV